MAGRPTKPEDQRRRRVLQIRLTDDESELIERSSKEANASAWAREVLLRAARRGKRPKKVD